jgi:hypothetical protein
MEEVIGGCRKLHKETLRNLYSLPSKIRMIKSRKIRGTGHVARMGRSGMHIGYWWESQKERNYYEGVDIVGRIILKWILEILDGVVWTGLIWLRIGTKGPVEGCCVHGDEPFHKRQIL